MKRAAGLALAASLSATLAFGTLAAQCQMGTQVGTQIGSDAAKPKGYVTYAAEPQTIKAGRPTTLELHFRVRDGFHVNSHTPRSELLIPTVIKLQPNDGVKTADLVYPAGTEYSFAFEPKEKLDVYSGAFTVRLPVTATPGDHTIDGVLRYQACDNAACYPPKSLLVQILVTAR